jgi:clan AA aspartic protease (TIGR02281 family)
MLVKTLSNMFAIASAVLLLASWQLSSSSSASVPGAVEDLDLLLKQRSYLTLEKALNSGGLSPSDRAFFEGVMANRRNRPAESITLLQPLIPSLSATNQERAVVALSTLADDYEKTFQYAAAADTYASLAHNFVPYMSGDQIKKATREAARWNLLRAAPAQSSAVDGPFTVETTRDRLGLVETSVTVAGQRISMILDTGANLSAINRSTALRLGLDLSPSQSTMEGMAGNPMLVHTAVIPELEIGKAVFHNVAVIVVEDKDMFVPSMQYALPGSLGFPVLTALGKITFFADERFGVGLRATPAKPASGNLFLQRLTPIVSATIRGKEELFTIDTGATGSLLSARYYKDYPHEFESQFVDELVLTGAGGTRSFPAYYASQITLSLGGACVRLDDVPVLIKPRGISDDYFYGNLGQSALNLFPSYTFDFQNMSFTVDGPACAQSDTSIR